MNREEARLSVMGAISMALKNPTLQQGFEIICKNLAELEKENAELKDYNKYLKRQRQGGIQKQYNKVSIIKQQKEQLTKAKGIIRDFISVAIDYIDKEDKNYSYIVEAQQFLNIEVEK